MAYTDYHRFVLAGASSMTAALATNPIDVIKIRLQLEGELNNIARIHRKYRGFFAGGSVIFVEEGVKGLYKGLTASLMREGSYSTIRLGAYEPVKELLGAEDIAHTPLYKKVLAGSITGAIGSAIASPTDLVKIRMQACRHTGHLTAEKVPRYNSTLAAFKEITLHEGLTGLWRGVGPTVQRAALLTATQIPSYDHSKHLLLNYGLVNEGLPAHILCSMFAGFMTATVTSPADVIKTRIMNQRLNADGTLAYSSTLDALQKIVKTEGFSGLFKGWFPNWMRIGPHTVIAFVIFEQLKQLTGLRPI